MLNFCKFVLLLYIILLQCCDVCCQVFRDNAELMSEYISPHFHITSLKHTQRYDGVTVT